MNRLNSQKNIRSSVGNIPTLLLLVIFSFGILFICAASSPRYAHTPWVDSNAFFTVGKSMAKGLVPYRDLFEQKGPLLYFIHALAYLISNTSFTGVYIFEALSLTVTLYYVYRLASLYLEKIPSILTAVITGAIITNSFCFYLGDSAEEFSLPSLTIAMYLLAKFFKDPDNTGFKWYTYLISGFLAGCIAMIKYSIIGIWFAWMAIIALYTLIAKRDVKGAFVNSFIFVGGMVLSVIPWIIYFGVNGAIKDFIDTYFLINSKSYSANQSYNPVYLICNIHKRFVQDSNYSYQLYIVMLAGIILSTVTKRIFPKKIFPHFVLPLVFCSNIFFTYFGTRCSYYFLTFVVFVPFAFITVFSFAELFIKNKLFIKSVFITALVIITIGVVPFSMKYNLSSKTVVRKNEETVQQSFCDYISEHNPKGKILNLGFLDGGFYVPNNSVPEFKHFERQNIPYENYPENIDEQNRYLNECLADYVIVRQISDPDENSVYTYYPTLKDKYKLVKTGNEFIIDVTTEKLNLTFYLYEKLPE